MTRPLSPAAPPPPDRPPLWRVIDETFNTDVGELDFGDGFGTTCGDPDNNTWAAVIRALADEVVPYEGPCYRNRSIASHVQWAKREARAEIRTLLLAEAERAEDAGATGV